jgi:hypothetical protein
VQAAIKILLHYSIVLLHNEEICNLYSSQNIIRVIKLRTVKWTGHSLHGDSEQFIQNFSWET